MIPLTGRVPRFAELERSIAVEPVNPSRPGQPAYRDELLDDLRDAARDARAVPEPERARRCIAIALAIELLGNASGRRLLSHIRMLRWSDAYAEADAIERTLVRTRVLEQRAGRRVYAVRRRPCDETAKGASA